MATALGEKIRALREEKKYSLQSLAEICGSSKSYIWELENRDTQNPSGEKLTALALALDTTVDYLLGESAAAPTSEVKDKVFFRNFNKLEEAERERVRQMVAAWSKK